MPIISTPRAWRRSSASARASWVCAMSATC
jgi:hypothetical protein